MSPKWWEADAPPLKAEVHYPPVLVLATSFLAGANWCGLNDSRAGQVITRPELIEGWAADTRYVVVAGPDDPIPPWWEQAIAMAAARYTPLEVP